MELKDKKVLIFDFDETIGNLDVRWGDLIHDIVELIGKKYNVGLNPNVYLTSLMKEVHDKVGIEGTKSYIPLQEKYEEENIEKVEPDKKIVEFIKNNKDNFTFAIWSGNTHKTIQKALEIFGIDDCFDIITCRSDLVETKPAPEGFENIKKKLGHKNEDYVFIGNSVRDDKGAADNAGIDFIHVDDFVKLI